MARLRYWFSAKQKRMRDALGGDATYVQADGQWIEYTQTTDADKEPAVWPDFKLVAEGEDLPCDTLKSSDGDGQGLLASTSRIGA